MFKSWRATGALTLQAEQLRGGKLGLMGFFVGQTMKETGGSANPAMVNAVIKRVLGLP